MIEAAPELPYGVEEVDIAFEHPDGPEQPCPVLHVLAVLFGELVRARLDLLLEVLFGRKPT